MEPTDAYFKKKTAACILSPDSHSWQQQKAQSQHIFSFARIRSAFNRDDVQNEYAEQKSNNDSKHISIKQSNEVHDGDIKQKYKAKDERVPTKQEPVTSPTKSKALANIRKAFQPCVLVLHRTSCSQTRGPSCSRDKLDQDSKPAQ